jgi:TolB-like protein
MKKFFMFFIVFLLVGCSSNTILTSLANKNEKSVDNILDYFSDNNSLEKKKIIVSTAYDIDNPIESSTIGRILTQNIISDFVKYGVRVEELDLVKNNLIQNKNGRIIISKDIESLASEKNVSYILLIAYKKVLKELYVNLKLISPETGNIVASSDYVIVNRDLLKLDDE